MLRGKDDHNLNQYLDKVTNFSPPHMKEEILVAFSHRIANTIANQIRVFGIMIDGTQEITGNEQESM